MYWNSLYVSKRINRWRLTLTWDVLKFLKKKKCLWKLKGLTLTWDVLKCNFEKPEFLGGYRLTLTWDVLKLINQISQILKEKRLTLTWDVLKLERVAQLKAEKEININMRCIEIAGNAEQLCKNW